MRLDEAVVELRYPMLMSALISITEDLAAVCSALVDGVITSEQQVTPQCMFRAARVAFRQYKQTVSILAWELVKQPPPQVPKPDVASTGNESSRGRPL